MLWHNKGEYQNILIKCLKLLIAGQFQDNFKISGISRISGQLGPLLINALLTAHDNPNPNPDPYPTNLNRQP